MFEKSQRFYDIIYSFKDYESEARRVHELIQQYAPGARTLLDVACGTGQHLQFLRENYEVEGLDLDPELLLLARQRVPGVALHKADMIEFDLGRQFDVVTCLFSSIGYVRSEENLRRAIATMARHLAPGGVFLVEPWFTPDAYQAPHVAANFVDEPDLKIARVARDLGRKPEGISLIEFQYLVGTAQEISHFTEHHELGLFTEEQHRDAFALAGLEVHHDPEGLMGRGLYITQRGPAAVPPTLS